MTQREHADWLVTQDRGGAAADLAATAALVFEQLGAEPDLQRARRLQPRVETLA